MANSRVKYNIMLHPEDIEPWMPGFEVIGVFNPGVCRVNGKYVFLLRVAEQPKNQNKYLRYSPRLEFKNGEVDVKVDTYRLGIECKQEETRSIYIFKKKRDRLTTLSHLRLATSPDGMEIDWVSPGPVIPFTRAEEYGQEDARITPINGEYIISSIAPSRKTIFTLFRKTKDFKSFSEPWKVGGREYKDTFPFPEKIQDRYCILTRPPGKSKRKPTIHIAFSGDLHSLDEERVLMYCRKEGFDSLSSGGGAPPLKTKKGWLEPYHGTEKRDKFNDLPLNGIYRDGFLLLDLDDPTRMIARSRDAFFEPQTNGYPFYPDVAFVSGAVLEDDLLRVFGGKDDQEVFSSEIPLRDVFDSIGYHEKERTEEPVLAGT